MDLSAGAVDRQRRPFGNDVEVGRNLKQRVEHQRSCFGDSLLHRQDANDVVANSQMMAFGLNVRVDDLVVEKLGGLRLARDAPVVIVEQSAEERELALAINHFYPNKVGKLTGKGFDMLVEASNLALDVRTQPRLHVVVAELRFEFGNRACWVTEQTCEHGRKASL